MMRVQCWRMKVVDLFDTSGLGLGLYASSWCQLLCTIDLYTIYDTKYSSYDRSIVDAIDTR